MEKDDENIEINDKESNNINKIKDKMKEKEEQNNIDDIQNFKINENSNINNNINKIDENNDLYEEINNNEENELENNNIDDNLKIDNTKQKQKQKNKEEYKFFTVDEFLNDFKEIDNEEKKEINMNNSFNVNKRRSAQINNLKLGKLSLKEEKSKDDFNKNSINSKKNKSNIKRSYSEAVIDDYEKKEKKNFFNELNDDPKYRKIIKLKEDTENAIKKTVNIKGSSSFIKSLVSKKKARFCYDGFDLDLTYITTKIIAMGLPSTSFEGLYRNNMEDVKKFFNKRHPKHHKVYNLCEEKNYPKDSFYQQGYYPFPDHEAPPLNSLMPFCKDAKEFLDESDENVVAIHCKAGKGRTGTFICCLLLYLGIFDTADESMKYYGLMRMGAEKGVSVPSQKRYVNYFEQIVKNKIPTPINSKSICITELKIYTVPRFSKLGSSCTPTFIIQNGKKNYKYSDYNKKKTTYNCSLESIDFPLGKSGFSVAGDVLITFYHLQFFGKDKMFKFWFNTHFLSDSCVLEIEKKGLDKAFKDKENKLFSPKFKIAVKYFFL